MPLVSGILDGIYGKLLVHSVNQIRHLTRGHFDYTGYGISARFSLSGFSNIFWVHMHAGPRTEIYTCSNIQTSTLLFLGPTVSFLTDSD